MKIKKHIFKDMLGWAAIVGIISAFFMAMASSGFDGEWLGAWSWWVLLGIYIVYEIIYIYYEKTYFRKNPKLDEFLAWNIALFVTALLDNVLISPFILGFKSIVKALYTGLSEIIIGIFNILIAHYIVVLIVVGIILLKICIWNIFFGGKK